MSRENAEITQQLILRHPLNSPQWKDVPPASRPCTNPLEELLFHAEAISKELLWWRWDGLGHLGMLSLISSTPEAEIEDLRKLYQDRIAFDQYVPVMQPWDLIKFALCEPAETHWEKRAMRTLLRFASMLLAVAEQDELERVYVNLQQRTQQNI